MSTETALERRMRLRKQSRLHNEGRKRIAAYIVDIKLLAITRQAGEEATEALGKVGWLLGLTAEAERAAAGDTPRLRALHLGVMAVQEACLGGYRWPAYLNPNVLTLQIDMANEVLHTYPNHVLAMIPGADHLEQVILQHLVTQESITGMELYEEAA